MTNVYVYVFIQTVILAMGFLAVFVLLNREVRLQQRQVEYVIFGCSIGNIGILLELISKGSMQMLIASRGVQVIGACMITIALINLTGYICKFQIPIWFTGTLLAADSLVVFTHFLDNYNDWFYASSHVEAVGAFMYLVVDYGPSGILFWMISIVFPFVSCFIMLIYALVQEVNAKRRREFITIMAIYVAIMLGAVIRYATNIMPYYNFVIPVTSIIFSLLVFSGWHYQGIDVVAAASQTAIDSISAGVITLNQYREIIYFNEAARKIIPEINYCNGLSIENLNLDLPTLKVGEEAELSFGGRRYFVSLTAIHDDNGVIHGYAIMFNDMTETFEMMEMIKEEQKRADEASQVKTAFLANISHEIRTPMNAIMGLSDLIIEESRGRKVYDMAVTIKKAANSLLDLVNNVLDISKLESGKMDLEERDYSLSAVVEDTMKVMEVPAAQKGLSLKLNLDDSLPCMLHGDDNKLRQCLGNVVNNALKFTQEGSVRLEVSGIRRNDKVALTFMVIDTGIGIRKDDLKRVFGEFEQVDRVLNKGKEGSGLGLTITRDLIELMGGVIDVSSVYGQGSTFTIRLTQDIVNDMPISQVESMVEEVVKDQRMFVAPGTKILIVDDNKVNLMVAKGLLEPYAMQIDTRSSGQEAIDAAKAKNYDIILMDHMMPGMDGVEATKYILENYKAAGDFKPYMVALTANAFGDIRQMFLTHGFQEFVSKPIEKEKLHSVLLKAIPDQKREFIDSFVKEDEYTEDELAELFMEGVDVRAAFQLHSCTKEDYLELLSLYLEEGKQKLQEIRAFYQARDWNNYSIYTHGLKSSSANIGANNLSEHAKKHEFASKDSNKIDEAYIDSDVEVLLKEYDDVLTEASRVIRKEQEKSKEQSAPKLDTISTDDLILYVQEAIELSEDFKSKEAAEAVDKMLRHSLPEAVEKKLSDVRMKYKLYDDDAAEGLLHELLDELSNDKN